MNKSRKIFSRGFAIMALCALFGVAHLIFGYNNVFAADGKCFYFIMDVTTQHNTDKTTVTSQTQRVCSATGKTNDIELKGATNQYANIVKEGSQLTMTMVNSGGASVRTDDVVKTYNLSNYSSIDKLSDQMKKDFFAQLGNGVTYGTAGARSWDGTTVKAASTYMRTETYGETISEETREDSENEQTSEQPGEGDQGDPCFNAGVDSMSWILCPALNNMNYTASALSNIVDGWLTVDTELYDTSSSTYTVWQVMRDISNGVVVIVLLVIIFSQLTGYGIDNYGIKKILPRLVIMAILINLSFVLCELAIDVSNILGGGLKNLFGSIGKLVMVNGEESYMEEFIGYVITSIFAVAGVAGAVAPAAISITTAVMSGGGPMAVVIIVLALIIVIAAILMFFIMLGARMIIIILCAAISPLAFACYILPNTQKFFKKWWDLFKVALVMFPICGALWGVSYLIKAMVLTMDGVHLWMLVVALIAPFLVFFLLPSLLKGAISALGSVGGALTAMGNSVRNGLRSGKQTLRNTEAYRSAQEQSRRNMTRWNAGLDRNCDRVNMGRFGRFVRGGERGIAQARAQYRKDVETQGLEGRMMGAGFEATVADAQAQIDARRVADYESLLSLGRARNNDNSIVNTDDARSLGTYHAEALARYRNAQNDEQRSDSMAQIKAAQNILSKTDAGRTQVQGNFENAIAHSGPEGSEGLSIAASHLLGSFGNQYKSVNRGAHAMLTDLATNDLSNAETMEKIRGKLDQKNENGDVIKSGAYSLAGTNKYTEESVVGADDSALQRIVDGINNGSLTGDALNDIRTTAYRAINNPNIHPKPEVERKLREIVGDYMPQQADSSSGILLPGVDVDLSREKERFDEQQRNNPNWPGN